MTQSPGTEDVEDVEVEDVGLLAEFKVSFALFTGWIGASIL